MAHHAWKWATEWVCIQRKYTWNSILFLIAIESEKHTHAHILIKSVSTIGFSFTLNFQFYRIDKVCYFISLSSSFSSTSFTWCNTNTVRHYNVVRKSNVRLNRNSISLSVQNGFISPFQSLCCKVKFNMSMLASKLYEEEKKKI